MGALVWRLWETEVDRMIIQARDRTHKRSWYNSGGIQSLIKNIIDKRNPQID